MTGTKGKNSGAPKILWIGGTSSLARTYLNRFGGDGLILAGHENTWLPSIRGAKNDNTGGSNDNDYEMPSYVTLDLTTITASQVREIFAKYEYKINAIIIGVRPKLMAAQINTDYATKIVRGLHLFLEAALSMTDNNNNNNINNSIQYVLHLSSVAALNHLQAQHFVSEAYPIPPLSDLIAPYDIFKRQCEQVVEQACQYHKVMYTHLRLSAIFSDTIQCIQCSALALQSRVGCYLPLAIDGNSGLNIALAIYAMVQRAATIANNDGNKTKRNNQTSKNLPLQHVYYYTRPLLLPRPMPYGYYLDCYRQAYGLTACKWSSIWIPVWMVTCFVSLIHGLARVIHCCKLSSWQLPYLDAVDYLLQVSSREHSFDCSRFANDFKGIQKQEESILECFLRRRTILETKSNNHGTKDA